ncbi:MAG: VWA domain-containing protein [Verrucomicrobiota bacterium]
MNFLFPAAWGGLVLALPVIALYLIRTRQERRSISTLLFWDQLKTQSTNSALWRKLRRWISLLVQLLFLLLLVFALTRPLVPWQSVQPSRTVFVLDPSASRSAREGDATRWERAVQILAGRIRQMRSFDRAAILLAGDPPQVLSGWTASRRALLDSLQQARPESGQIPLRPALALAENLKMTQPNSSIVLLTDGVWKDKDEAPAGVECLWIGEPQPNTGITHFSARRSFAAPGEVRVSAEVVSHAKAGVNGAIELTRDGHWVDVQNLSLAPGETWQREWDVRTDEAAVFEARLTDFPADALRADDSARATVEAVAPIKVLLVSGPNAYIEAALSALPLVEWARVEPGGYKGFSDPQTLYVFNRTPAPESFEKANILLINPPVAGFWGNPVGAVERPLVSEVNPNQPLLRHTGFARVTLAAATRWEKPPQAQVFADSFGDPLIYGQWDDRQKWAVLGFDLDGSDFVLRTAFPILLGNAVESLRPAKNVSASTAPGKIESALERSVPQEAAGKQTSAAPSGWWFAFPLWWWAVGAACVWLLGEWWLYSRRVTE